MQTPTSSWPATSAGMLVFARAFPWLQEFYLATEMGDVARPQVFDVSRWVVVGGVVAIALAGFYVASAVERAYAGRVHDAS